MLLFSKEIILSIENESMYLIRGLLSFLKMSMGSGLFIYLGGNFKINQSREVSDELNTLMHENGNRLVKSKTKENY